MAKFIIAKTLTIKVNNYNFGSPEIQMNIPLSYSLHDLIQIIKISTGYTDNYDWKFRNPYEENKNLSLKNDSDKIKNISFGKYKSVTPYIICIYGSIELYLGVRGFVKYRKVYPTIYQAVGKFPTEEEFVKNIEIQDIDGKYTVPMKTLPSAQHLISDKLIETGERLKEYFKNRYKISDEIVEGSTFAENKLVRK